MKLIKRIQRLSVREGILINGINPKDPFKPPNLNPSWRRWLGVGITVIVLVVVGWIAIPLIQTCGSIGSGVKRIDGECVGVTDGSYLFNSAFEDVQKKIEDENARVRAEASSSVTVALLDLLTPTTASAKSVENVRSELEGAYTAQRRINERAGSPSSTPQIQLVLANQGNSDTQWQWVAGQLVEKKEAVSPLVAVIGLGVSTEQTRQRAVKLSDHGIPMVGALLTADELNNTTIPGLIRVSPPTMAYAKALRRYVDARNNLRSAVLVYDTNSDSGADLFTKSLRDDLKQQMLHLIGVRPLLGFTGASIPTDRSIGRFDVLTPNICASPPVDVVLYAGRKVDLGGFLDWLEIRQCKAIPLTVITAADIGRVLIDREVQMREGNFTVVHAGTSDPEGWGRSVAETPQYYAEFLQEFEKHIFDPTNLNDGEAIMMHDALQTVAKALLLATQDNSSPTAGRVRGMLLNLNGQHEVQGASGNLSFTSTSEGNPVGKLVPVLEFPSPADDPAGQQVVTPIYKTE